MAASPQPPPSQTGPSVWMTWRTGGSRPNAGVTIVLPGSQGPIAAPAAARRGPAAWWIAPSIPPPPSSGSFAAVTIASTPWTVISPSTTGLDLGRSAFCQGLRSRVTARRIVDRASRSAPSITQRHHRLPEVAHWLLRVHIPWRMIASWSMCGIYQIPSKWSGTLSRRGRASTCGPGIGRTTIQDAERCGAKTGRFVRKCCSRCCAGPSECPRAR